MKTIVLLLAFIAAGTCVNAQSPVIIRDLYPGSLDGTVVTEHLRVGSNIYFWGNDGVTGNELWITDGTATGTRLVKEIIPGSKGAVTINMLGTYQGKLIFAADDSVHGREPWISDGTAAGTFMLADINTGTAHSFPAYPAECLGKLYFQADDGTHGQEPWVSDGTVAGTQLLQDVQPGFSSSAPRYFIAYNGAVYFQAYNATYGFEPWVTTGSGATIFSDLQPGFANGGFEAPCVFNNRLYFSSYSPANGQELWVTDGQAVNTGLFADLNPGPGDGFVSGSAIDTINHKMAFMASDGVHGFELWASDGTVAGTAMLKDIDLTGPGSYPENFVKLHGRLYFLTSEVNFSLKNLWRTDLTAAGTERVSPSAPSIANWVRYPTVWHDSLYFFNYGTTSGNISLYDLFVTAGDSASVRKINRLSLQDAINTNSWLDATDHGIVYRARYDVGTGYELYTLDYPPTTKVASTEGDDMVRIYPNPASSVLHIGFHGKRNAGTEARLTSATGVTLILQSNLPDDYVLNLSSYPAGIYFLRLTSNKGIITRKIIKE